MTNGRHVSSPELRITLIGCGGIGGHLAPNLCRFLHAERRSAHVTLVDGDAFEERNRSRMRFAALGNKAVVLARELATAFGDVLTIEPRPEYVTEENVQSVVRDGDVVLLAVDNHATRRVVDAHVATLADVIVVSGGNDAIEEGRNGTYGNVQIVRRTGGRACTNSLARFHPEIATPRDTLPTELGCGELASVAPQLLFTNLAVASVMLNAVYGILHGAVRYEEVYVDIQGNRVSPVERPVR
jgi:predicted dinucleotide-binding enzyme